MMTRPCWKCDELIGAQFDTCGHCGALTSGGSARSSAAGAVYPLRAAGRASRGTRTKFQYSTRSLLLVMTAAAPTFMLSPKIWEELLTVAAIGAIATAIGALLTRTLIDGIYGACDWVARQRG